MPTMIRRRSRAGFSLPELLISLIVLGIIGASSVRLFIAQTGFYDAQVKQRSARTVARSSVNVLLSELRMVERTGGLEAASPTSVTLRVPLSIGMVCGTIGGVTLVSMLPTDSTVVADGDVSGFAWRDINGAYTYLDGTTASNGAAAACLGMANITTLDGGRTLRLSPALPFAASAGDAGFLYQRVRYEFGPSGALPGRLALFRTLVGTGAREELAAPFDTSARFRFYQLDRDTSDVDTPALADIQGLELVFNATSLRPRAGRAVPERTLYRTSVLFNNRINY